MKFLSILLVMLLTVCSLFLSACSNTLPDEVIAALTKPEVVDRDANTFVMKGDWQCLSPSKDCEIRVPLGGDAANASTERMRMLVGYYSQQDSALDWFRAFTPFLNQGLNIWDNNRRDKRNNDYLLKQLESQSNEQMALYSMVEGLSLNASNASAGIANAGFDMFGQLANGYALTFGGLAESNASMFASIFNAQSETTRSIFEFMPDSGDNISNNYSYDYNDAFNQYADSFNPTTTNQTLQPINWEGLTSFAGVFNPAPVPVVEAPEPIEDAP